MPLRTLPLIAFALLISCHCARSQDKTFPKKYRNISFVSQKLTQTGTDDHEYDYGEPLSLKSKIGAGITVGRTYFVHQKPLGGMVRFGIDATFFDINYANYSRTFTDDYYYDESWSVKYHQADVGLQAGPSVMVNPVSKLTISAHLRYAPTYSLLYVSEDSDIYGTFSSFFVTGGAVTYGKVGVGVEARFGKGNYKRFGGGGDDDDGYDYDDYESPSKVKLKTSGVRVYLSFRF